MWLAKGNVDGTGSATAQSTRDAQGQVQAPLPTPTLQAQENRWVEGENVPEKDRTGP